MKADDLAALARRIEGERESILFDDRLTEGPDDDELAVSEYLSALAYLELAHRAARRAAVHQKRHEGRARG